MMAHTARLMPLWAGVGGLCLGLYLTALAISLVLTCAVAVVTMAALWWAVRYHTR